MAVYIFGYYAGDFMVDGTAHMQMRMRSLWWKQITQNTKDFTGMLFCYFSNQLDFTFDIT